VIVDFDSNDPGRRDQTRGAVKHLVPAGAAQSTIVNRKSSIIRAVAPPSDPPGTRAAQGRNSQPERR
jgi:hypothetical protein